MKIIRLMADYQCFPLWDVSPGSCGDIDPDELPISQKLKSDLMSWALKYDGTLDAEYPPHSKFPSDADEAEFNEEGRCLLVRLRGELKDYVVIGKMLM